MSEPRLSAARKLAQVRERQAGLLQEAREAARRAEAELARARAELAKVESETPHLVRLAELRVEAAGVRRQLRQLRGVPTAAGNTNEGEAAGTVETQAGETRPLSRAAALAVRAAIGRRRAGLLAPLDGEVAQGLLRALDEGGHVGDRFSVRLGGKKGSLRFEVIPAGLSFRHAPS